MALAHLVLTGACGLSIPAEPVELERCVCQQKLSSRGLDVAPIARGCVISPSETKGSPRTALRVQRAGSSPLRPVRPKVVHGDEDCETTHACSPMVPRNGSHSILRSRRFFDFISHSGLFCQLSKSFNLRVTPNKFTTTKTPLLQVFGRPATAANTSRGKWVFGS